MLPVKRLGGLLLLITLLIPATTATTIGISPDAIEPGGTITVNVDDLPDGTSFALGIRSEFTTIPGEASVFTVRNLTLPFALNSGEMSAYTRGTNWTELAVNLPDGGTVIILKYADQNGEVRIVQSCNIESGTISPVTLRGEAAASSITADLTMLGTKQGQDSGIILFAIEGIEQDIVTVTVYVDGCEALSRVIPVGASPTPTPPPTQAPPVSRAPAIVSNKDSIIRGNCFVVTVTGAAKKDYRLYVREISGVAPGAYPVIVPGQIAVPSYTVPGEDDSNRTIMTNAAGTATIQFNTSQSTGEWRYTIRVEDPADPTIYDDVRVRVEHGAVTITTSGTGVYCFGEEITISGTNTDGDTTYLFLTGPNLDRDGVNLTLLRKVDPADPNTFDKARVNADDTWSKKWDTGATGGYLDPGGYTIYAVSAPMNKGRLSEAKYAAATIALRSPTLSAQTSGATLTPGEDYRISGIATGAPDAVQVWIFGPSYYKLGVPVMVESDSTFAYILTGAETRDLPRGQYYIVVQHPRSNGFNVQADAKTGQIYGHGINNVTLTALQAPVAASALINALNSPNVDDIYIKLSFTVDKSWIRIDGFSDQTYGGAFRIAGTTSYPPGTVLTYRIVAQDSGVVSLSGEVVVSNNSEWSTVLDTTTIGPGAYTFSIRAPDGQASSTALFDIYDDIIHPVPPGGGSYRVERIDITPSLDNLYPGGEVALDGIVRLDGAIGYPYSASGSECLEFVTDIKAPTWFYNLNVDGHLLYTEPATTTSRSFTLSSWELDYSRNPVRIYVSLSGTVPEAGTNDPILLRILQRDADGRVIPNSEYRLPLTPAGDNPPPPSPDNLTLFPGWNFISIPRPLAAENDTAAIFAGVETGGRSILRYDTAAGDWTALDEQDRLAPLEGFWIYSAGPTAVPLNFSTDPLLPPAERTLVAGWNAIGTTGNTPATARDTLYSVKGRWTTLIGFDARTQAFETGIVNGGSGANTDTRSVYPGRGYWLSMTGPGTLYAIGA